MKTLGLIGGMSWESTAEYYRLFNEIARSRLGGLHSAKLLLWSFDFAEIEALQAEGNWEEATRRMVDAGKSLKRGGAEILLICTNTMHLMAEEVMEGAGLPLIHIADATAGAIMKSTSRRPLLLGTRFTMEKDFYKGRLKDRYGLDVLIPGEEEMDVVHRVIFEELCAGVVKESSRAAFLKIIENARAGHGADGVILGCTEIPMLVDQADLEIPVFDTTRIHAEAAMDAAF